MSIDRSKDAGYRQGRAGLVGAVLLLAAALWFGLGYQMHWPVAVHGLFVIALFGVAMLLFFAARGRRSDGDTRGGVADKTKGSTHGK
jgi:hypothetical protein